MYILSCVYKISKDPKAESLMGNLLKIGNKTKSNIKTKENITLLVQNANTNFFQRYMNRDTNLHEYIFHT